MNSPERKSLLKSGLLKRFIAIPMFSPEGLLVWALLIFCFYGLLTLMGLRAFTAILSGAYPYPETDKQLSGFYGLIYLLSYLGFVFMGPILVITAFIQKVFFLLFDKKKENHSEV